MIYIYIYFPVVWISHADHHQYLLAGSHFVTAESKTTTNYSNLHFPLPRGDRYSTVFGSYFQLGRECCHNRIIRSDAEINQFFSAKLVIQMFEFTDRYLLLVCSAYARKSRKIRGRRDSRRKSCRLISRARWPRILKKSLKSHDFHLRSGWLNCDPASTCSVYENTNLLSAPEYLVTRKSVCAKSIGTLCKILKFLT